MQPRQTKPACLPEQGLGVAIKMDDGNTARGAEIVMAALLERLLTLAPPDATLLQGWSDTTLTNWNGLEVGRLRAHASLRRCA